MRALIVGSGAIGQRHVRNLSGLYPDIDFIFLRRSMNPESPVPGIAFRVVVNIDDALQLSPDFAVVASPSALHIEVLPKLIAASVPSYVEKPVVTNTDDFDLIALALAVNPNPGHVAGFNLLLLPSLVQARQIVAEGRLGTIVRAVFSAGQWLPDWRSTRSKHNSIDDRIGDFHYFITSTKLGLGRATHNAQDIRYGIIKLVVLVKHFDRQFPNRFAAKIFRYLSISFAEFPAASKMLEQPTTDREYFDRLAPDIRGVHLEGPPVTGTLQQSALGPSADDRACIYIVNGPYGRNHPFDIIAHAANQAFIPDPVGGGIRSVDDARRMLRAAVDHIAINTVAIAWPELTFEVAHRLGSQRQRTALDLDKPRRHAQGLRLGPAPRSLCRRADSAHRQWRHGQHLAPDGRRSRGQADVLNYKPMQLAVPDIPAIRQADCDYGWHRVRTAITWGDVTATQFDPERGGYVDLTMIKKFWLAGAQCGR